MNKHVQYGRGSDPFRGPPYQLGYGLGGSFRKFFKWIIPLVKQHTLPHVADIGRTAMSSVGDFARDVAQGQDLKSSATLHMNKAVAAVKEQVEKKLRGGKRKKRKIIRKTKPKDKIIIRKQSKKFSDIFV